MSAEPVRLYALPHLDSAQRTEITVAAGLTISDIVAIAMPAATQEQRAVARVIIGDSIIPHEAWGKVRPKPGVAVIVRLVPESSGLLRSALSITVAVAAMALGQFYVGPILLGAGGLGLTGTALTAATSVATGALGIAGTLLVNSLIPLRQSHNSNNFNLPSYSVQGWKNNANPDAPIPCILGTMRYAAPFAAGPYTEASGDDSYVTGLFNFGYGALSIPTATLRIGDTPLSKYTEVNYELREGYGADAPVTIYPTQVIEEHVSVELSNVHASNFWPDSRFTAADSTECAIDFTFPNGLIAFTEQKVGNTTVNRQGPWGVNFKIEQRLETSSTWTTVQDPMTVSGETQRTFVRTYRWTLPSRGRYEIRITRTNDDWDDWDQSSQTWKIISRSWWSAIRSYRPEYPLNFGKPLALCAVKVKATRQLNGTLDNFNAICSRICLDWDSGTSTWVTRATKNPASLFRYVLQSNAFAYPKADSEIDLVQLQYWHEFCATRGLAYNRVQDYEATLYDVLGDIAAAGRAAPGIDNGKWTVIIDEVKTTVIAHISPRNSWSFSGERPYVRFPDGFRVRFQDETSTFGYTEAERIIPWPGFVGDPQIVEAIDLPGLTDPAQIWIEARRRQYELIYRRDEWTVMMDYESLVCRRGDLVRLSHDVLDRVQVSSRVKMISADHVLLDDVVTMEASTSYAVRFRKLPSSDSAADISVVRRVSTHAGMTDTLYFSDTGDLPAVGDLAFFGVYGSESFEAIVKSIEGAENMTRRVTLIPHAPEIQTLADAEIVPPWDGRVGAEIIVSGSTPAVPIIGTIVSGVDAGPEPPILVYIPVSIGSGGGGTTYFEIDHRLVGAGSWTVALVPVASGGTTINTYSKGDHIEVRARAIGTAVSAYTSTVTHTVAANDPVAQQVTAFTVTQVGSSWRYEFTLNSQPSGTGVRIKYRTGHYTVWSDLTSSFGGVITSSPYDSSTPTIVSATEYSFGAIALDSSGAESGTPIILQVTTS
ncbi:hypothetical+protein [Methylocapsa aurea]|uniref:host specificity factor TipJ family phage tail protein n=1 Tax=Methylocapsa aurea TaxID=663610 RepID=UPI003D18F324